jgi:subtilisin family serine protease
MNGVLGFDFLIGRFIFFYLLVFAQSGITQTFSKIDPKLSIIAHNNPMDVIIMMNEQTDLSEAKSLKGKNAKASFVYKKLINTAQSSQKGIIQTLKNNNVNYQSFYLVNMIEAKMNRAQIHALTSREDVRFIMENGNLYQEEVIRNPELIVGSPRMPIWNLEAIGAPAVWAKGVKGQGVVIGGQDTGYAWDVATIKSKYRGWNGISANHNYSWHDAIHNENTMTSAGNPCGYNIVAPCDDDNHGTHTMGTMVGGVDNQGNEIGVAPSSKWIGCRNMEQGYGTLTTYTECFQWFLAPYAIGGNSSQGQSDSMPHVINNSWACPPIEGCNASNWEVMRIAIQNLKAAGCVVVVSAGNSGSNCSTVSSPPAIFGESYSVGASNSSNQIASFSSRGHVTVDGSNRIKPDISAPGVNVRSCLKDGSFANYNGTSMAGPHVAGLVALMISANQALSGEVDKIQEIINYTAKHMTSTQTCNNVPGTSIPNNTFGYGIIDAEAAIDLVLPQSYLPNVVYHNSVLIDQHNSGLVLTNALNQKLRIRIDNSGVIRKDTNAVLNPYSIQIRESSIKMGTPNAKLILTSDNGKKWSLNIDNNGLLSTVEVMSLPPEVTIISSDLYVSDPKHGILLKTVTNHEFAINISKLYHLLTIPMPNSN